MVTVGWREWVGLPELGIRHIKVKVDTGARTSALHAFEVTPAFERGEPVVSFGIHPLQYDLRKAVFVSVPIIDQRWVTDSGGHKERRYVIATTIRLGEHQWPIEATLTSRENMRFRMLLGRTAMAGRLRVDPARSFLIGEPPA